MKAFQVTSSGFGRQLFLAETVEGAIGEFNKHAEKCAKQNQEEVSPADTVITSVRKIGLVLNHQP